MADAMPGERQRRWRKENPERVRQYNRNYLRQKYLAAFLAEYGYLTPETRTEKNDHPPDPREAQQMAGK